MILIKQCNGCCEIVWHKFYKLYAAGLLKSHFFLSIFWIWRLVKIRRSYFDKCENFNDSGVWLIKSTKHSLFLLLAIFFKHLCPRCPDLSSEDTWCPRAICQKNISWRVVFLLWNSVEQKIIINSTLCTIDRHFLWAQFVSFNGSNFLYHFLEPDYILSTIIFFLLL